MSAITFAYVTRLVKALQIELSLSVLIEVGIFKGDKIAQLWPYFYKVIAIEQSEMLWADTAKRFEDYPQVQILLGKSKDKLSEFQTEFENVGVLYWLGHGSVTMDFVAEIPLGHLLEELQAIGKLNNTSIVLIDDAQLFLDPPLAPQDTPLQTGFHEILSCLISLSSEHELMVINDTIAFFPKKAKTTMEFYAQSNEELEAYSKLPIKNIGSTEKQLEKYIFIEQFSGMKTQKNKEAALIKQLINIYEEKKEENYMYEAMQELKVNYLATQAQLLQLENLISQQNHGLSDKTLIWLIKETLNFKNQSTNDQENFNVLASDGDSIDKFHLVLLKSLEQKEEVIKDLTKALEAYRAALNVTKYLKRPFLKTRFMAIIAPRIGNLYQYAPRPIGVQHKDRQFSILLDSPKFSIVTPSYRQAEYIARTIDSVLEQNYPNLEYFIQDGGSEDGTVDVLKAYESHLFGWESMADDGQSQAINLGFNRTSGEIMGWLNSDDLLLPGTLKIVANYFSTHPEVDVVYGNRLLIDEHDREIGRWIMPGHDGNVLTWVDYIPQETLFWRRSMWNKVGGHIDESFRFAMDWDLLVRFRDAGAHFAHISLFLGAFRIHDAQKTTLEINHIGNVEMDRIRERLLGRVPTRIEIRRAILPFLFKHVAMDMIFRIKTRLGLNK
jgi:glycosyltransferase involved in cell wall biosynthesis